MGRIHRSSHKAREGHMECCESSKLTTSHRPSFGAFDCVGFTRVSERSAFDGMSVGKPSTERRREDWCPPQECVRGTHRRPSGTTHQPRRTQEAEERAREAATAAQAQRPQHPPAAKHAEVVVEYSTQSESDDGEAIVDPAADERSWMRPLLGLRQSHWESSHYGNKRASTEFHSWESSHAHWSEYAHHRSSWDSSH